MTIDITVGKIVFKCDEDIAEYLKSLNYFRYDQIDLHKLFYVEQCPDEDVGCTQDDTHFPGSAYRSGNSSAVSDFFCKVAPELYDILCPKKTNDMQVTRINLHIEAINALKPIGEHCHDKRLHWLKFWCNKAVELYGKEAVIKFT
jgi:hypothetical protein